QRRLDRLAELAVERFAPRARRYDEAARFPQEDFEDLIAEGFHAAVVPVEHGGLGLGPLYGSAFSLWMMTRELAKVDLSLARCWEGHMNSLVLLDGIASEEQKRRFFAGVVEGGELWAAWSGEPQVPKPGEKRRFGTTVERRDGGFVVDGTKIFATSAPACHWGLLLVNEAGPGGARHADAAAAEHLLLLACPMDDPSIAVDGSWWDPIGMRATVSHLVRFDRTFIPAENVVGRPGQYLRDGWQTRFIPHYAASFLGAAEAAWDYALAYAGEQDRGDDPYVQHRLARMAIDLKTARLWLWHVSELWRLERRAEAELAGSEARYLIEHLAEDALRHAIRVCGARCLNRPSPIERIYRDLTLYLRHDNDDQILATVGRAVLGKAHDPSFYKP
ncbi:MAG: acyl-CoA dehydrogenase, partial [Acidobacteria bacterium]